MGMEGVDKAITLGWDVVRKNSERYERRRYLYEELEKRKTAETIEVVVGLRGSGKTVLLSQIVAEEAFAYLSLDYPPLQQYSLYDILKYVVEEYGPKHVVLDEFHKKKEMAELRMFHEAYKGEVKVWVSGSNGLEMEALSLERRVALHHLKPFSLREYVAFREGIEERTYTLEEIWQGEAQHLARYDGFIKKHYREALPYLLTGGQREALIHGILEDVTAFMRADAYSRGNLLKVLYYVADTLGEVSLDSASHETGLPKSQIYRYLELLTKARVVLAVESYKKGFRKRRKYYLSPPIRAALLELKGQEAGEGTIWEEFFVSQLHPQLSYLPGKGKADFVVDGKVVEVGGKAKDKHQRADVYVIAGRPPKKGEVPLAAFGFLY